MVDFKDLTRDKQKLLLIVQNKLEKEHIIYHLPKA